MMTAPLGSRQARNEATERDKRARRFLLRLSLANWAIAIVAWTVSAFLGITSPASIIIYSVLFVIGLFAVIVAVVTYLLEKYAHRPPDNEHADLDDAGEASEPPADVSEAPKPEGGSSKDAEPKAEPKAAEPKAARPKAQPKADEPKAAQPGTDGDKGGAPAAAAD